MSPRVALIGAVAALCSATSIAQQTKSAGEESPPPCEGELFVFQSGPTGHVAKVTLCSKKDATSDDLLKMFESAAAALAQNHRMAPEKRTDLVAQMRAKAAQLRDGKSATATLDLAPPAAALAPLRPATPAERPPEYTVLPPLPAPKPSVSAATLGSASASLALSKPQLRIECLNQADLAGAGPCDSLERETILKVRAGDAIPSGTSLRFLRRGDLRAEIQLAQMARGKTAQFVLPREVCTGVVESKVEIQVVSKAGARDSAGRVVDTMGPYLLRC